jgi:hypothetical protein
LPDAAHALLKQWNLYRESDLSQMNAHDLLVRYELWNALDAALWPGESCTPIDWLVRELRDWRSELIPGTYAETRLARILAKIEETPDHTTQKGSDNA